MSLARFTLHALTLSFVAAPGLAQHADHANTAASGRRLSLGAHAVPLVTSATPTAAGQRLTEAYLSQLAVMTMASAAGGRLEAVAMINFEGLTLARGELSTGGYGEGFVDRRHPHSYVHELVATVRSAPASPSAPVPAPSPRVEWSLSAGRGFATFGSDDPMVRPFAKYPVNHHLAQVLERVVVAGALRAGPATLEVSAFNGDEPSSPRDMPELSRFGDSWAARLTLHPTASVELSLSHAMIESPEVEGGFGLDARKWHAGARVERGPFYALAEWARSTGEDDGDVGDSFESLLGEVAAAHGGWTAALRIERTDRHEEERLGNPFRTAQGSPSGHAIAITRWHTVTFAASRRLNGWMGMRFVPFAEVALIRPTLREGIVFDPRAFYGSGTLAMLSAGVRLTAGTWHARMGRYGVAAPTSHTTH